MTKRKGPKVNNRRAVFITAVAFCLFLLTGCVKRNLHIESDPPGAAVFFNENNVGTTPMDFDFMHYAVHRVELKKEGYKTLSVLQNIKPPLHLWPPLDFFFEIIPKDFWDRKEVFYTLTPLPSE